MQHEARLITEKGLPVVSNYAPQLSISILSLMGRFLEFNCDPISRIVQQLLKSNSISPVVAYGISDTSTKSNTYDMVVFLGQILHSKLVNHNVGVLNIADGIFAHNQVNLRKLMSRCNTTLAKISGTKYTV